MKGVILTQAPAVQIVDITHELPAFSLLPAAYAIDQAASFYPPGTIHVVIVDPGVGTSRKPLLVQAGGYRFIAPDNGVLSLIVERYPDAIFRELDNRSLFHEPVSATFHGRDIFAAVAGHLASGKTEANSVGPIVDGIVTLPVTPIQLAEDTWQGMVLSIDRFGNVITNLPAKYLKAGSVLRAGGQSIAAFYPTFGAAPAGVCFLYKGSSGYLELGINQESAAARLEVGPGTCLTLLFSGPR